jgi:hypothetical protein
VLDGLDSIPWSRLTHAYGAADDVPDLIRALRTADPEARGEESPLWHLFGNIWHQGTVYEATSYAVPFLIELAASADTPNRVGILFLLASIATGSSYCAVHDDAHQQDLHAARLATELEWVGRAHHAVAAGSDTFTALTHETGPVRLAAAHVLALLPEYASSVAALLRELLRAEGEAAKRGGILLLLGHTRDGSPETCRVLEEALRAGGAPERHAATLAAARVMPQPFSPLVRSAILETIVTDDFEDLFEDLPWDANQEAHPHRLLPHLDKSMVDEAARTLIARLESGEAQHGTVDTLLDLLFPCPDRGPPPRIRGVDLTPLQARAVRALATALKGERRIFCGHFPQWGLPDTRQEWSAFVAEIPPLQ